MITQINTFKLALAHRHRPAPEAGSTSVPWRAAFSYGTAHPAVARLLQVTVQVTVQVTHLLKGPGVATLLEDTTSSIQFLDPTSCGISIELDNISTSCGTSLFY